MSVQSASFSVGLDFTKLKEAANDLSNAVNIIKTKIRPKYNRKAKFALELLAEHAVTEFYDSYSPHVYERKEDLLNAYKITADDEEWSIDTGAQYMNGGHRIDNNYIFENSFIRGWHGGAISASRGPAHPQPGTPWWKAPVGQYTYWLSPAAKGPAPQDYIDDEFDNTIEPIEQAYGDEACDLLELQIAKIRDALSSLI